LLPAIYAALRIMRLQLMDALILLPPQPAPPPRPPPPAGPECRRHGSKRLRHGLPNLRACGQNAFQACAMYPPLPPTPTHKPTHPPTHPPTPPSCCTGVPGDSDNVYCNGPNNKTCYFYYQDGQSQNQAKAKCAGINGWLVAYNSAAEQLDVERYFAGAPPLPAPACQLASLCLEARVKGACFGVTRPHKGPTTGC
jgi:hypothetical protein